MWREAVRYVLSRLHACRPVCFQHQETFSTVPKASRPASAQSAPCTSTERGSAAFCFARPVELAGVLVAVWSVAL